MGRSLPQPPLSARPDVATGRQGLCTSHPHQRVFPYDELHAQVETVQAVSAGTTSSSARETGSGMTEAFMLPFIDQCLRLRDQRPPKRRQPSGLKKPMNALANDRSKLRMTLAGTSVTFGPLQRRGGRNISTQRAPLQRPRHLYGAQRAAYNRVMAASCFEALPYP